MFNRIFICHVYLLSIILCIIDVVYIKSNSLQLGVYFIVINNLTEQPSRRANNIMKLYCCIKTIGTGVSNRKKLKAHDFGIRIIKPWFFRISPRSFYL